MLFRCFNDECVSINQVFTDKDEVLKKIASIAKKSVSTEHITENDIYLGLKERESLGSTGFEKGIAIPHCSLKGLNDFIVGMLTVPEGVDFNSFDGSKAEIIVFILAPEGKRNEHIRLLSQISNVMHVKDIKKELFSANDPVSLKENFFRHITIDLDKEKIKKYQQFTVVVQKEDFFEDILRIFGETNECSVTVIEANNALSYLEAQPLFSSFWNEEAKGFNRVIVAIVKNSLSNDTIRKLNDFIAKNEDEPGLLFTVQEIFYMNGKLNL